MGTRSEVRKSTNSRRAFFRNSGTALLAGYAFTNRTGLAQTIQRPNSDRYQSIQLHTHEFYGDIQERFDFPKDWEIDILHMAGHATPTMTPEQIVQRLRSPIGTKQLRDIAAGKKTAAVTFDDTTRATPIHQVAEHVVNELNAAGIDDDHILFICGLGTHDDCPNPEARAKLGPVYDRCPWINHSAFQNHVEVGNSRYGNHIQLNGYFYKTDVRVLIGGIKNHPYAGYGGGAKGVLPGVVSYDTVFYNHHIVLEMDNTGETHVTDNEVRLDMIDAARLSKVDFSVNIVFNGERKVINVFAGDVVDAHLEACSYAHKQIHDEREVNTQDYDIVVRNSYPRIKEGSTSFGRPREGGTSVVICQNPLGQRPVHYYWERRRYDSQPWWNGYYRPREAGSYRQLIHSQYLPRANVMNFASAEMYPTWDQILAILEREHKGGAKVLLYPYYGAQWRPKTYT